MADINSLPPAKAHGSIAQEGAPGEDATPPTVEVIEQLFFAYRDFVGEPDAILADLGFGRAHHRVLHFVYRSPGMTVAVLLDILQITKQSLSRVLKTLIETGYIEQKEGDRDRRPAPPVHHGQRNRFGRASHRHTIDTDRRRNWPDSRPLIAAMSAASFAAS